MNDIVQPSVTPSHSTSDRFDQIRGSEVSIKVDETTGDVCIKVNGSFVMPHALVCRLLRSVVDV